MFLCFCSQTFDTFALRLVGTLKFLYDFLDGGAGEDVHSTAVDILSGIQQLAENNVAGRRDADTAKC